MSEDNKINILFASAECLPFCANGGVADMCYALSKYLSRNPNLDVRVVLPYYTQIPEMYKSKFKPAGERNVELSWRQEYCGIYEYEKDNITYYFIDNKRYFDREKLFGYDDDVERFSFFSKAVLDMFPIISFYPDIIHTHDWQSSMVCTFLKILEWHNPKYEHIKTVLNIHNLLYQGKNNFGIVKDLLGVEDKFAYLFDFFGEANITKASILCADQVVTVSETYKYEILNTIKGYGLQNVLEQSQHKLSGIINGIDYEFYNPSTDPTIYQMFDRDSLELRTQNKLKLQEELGLPVDANIPLYSYIGLMAEHKGFDLISQTIDELVSKGIQFVAVGTVSPDYENFVRSLNEKYPHNVRINIGYGGHLAKKLYAASDFILNPASVEPCGLCPLIANRYGALPICYETGGIKDNIKDFKQPDGNGYLFNDYDKNTFVDLINRTLHDYQNKDRMKQYILQGMSKSFDIVDCANKYLALYEEM